MKTLHRLRFSILAGVALLPLGLAGCFGGGGGGDSGTQYDYGISLTPDKTVVEPGGTVNLNVKYDAPANNAGITWQVSCALGDCGSVSSAGIYTAPAKVSQQVKVGIKATSNDQPAQGYYVEIWVTGKIVVTLFPQDLPAIHVNDTQQFTAQVNSSDGAVTWQVNGVTGGNSTVGTITTAGLYTAPATVPEPALVTILAIAHVDSTATASVPTTILPAAEIAVYITPYDTTVNINATLQYTAQVVNTSDTAVTWQVNGIEGGNSTVGTISTTGLFTAPATVPSPAVEVITAVSHADSTKTGLTHVTITNNATQNGLLSGPYAFEIAGPDSSDAMRAAVGYLSFDGNGGFVAMMDLNYELLTGGAQTALQYAGTYAIDQDYRGTMTFNINPALTFAFTLNSKANDAKLVEYDTRGTHYVGVMQKQTPADFTMSKLNGDYAFQLYGATYLDESVGVVGRFHADGAGNLTAASLDVKEAGQNSQALTNLSGVATITDATRGRGTVTLMQSATALAHFSFYMTNAGDVFMLSNDPVPDDYPVLAGRILSQLGGPFSNTSLSGPAVFARWGDRGSPTDYCLDVGQWSANSSTRLLTGNWDQNCNGTVTNTPYTYTSLFNIDATGRGVLAGASGAVTDVFYLISPNKAFLLQTYAPGSAIGLIEPQQATTFDNSLFNGTYRIGPISMPRPGADISQGYLIADGAGNLSGAENVLGSDGPVPTTFSGTYSVDATGRTVINFTTPELFRYVAYPVSAKRFFGVSIEPGDSFASMGGLDQ